MVERPMVELDEADVLARSTAAAARTWPGAELVGLRRLEGGVSSLTFAATLRVPAQDERATVLKVAPPGVAPVRNRDVLRQARLLRALAGRPGITVPAVWFEDEGSPPLFGMQLAPGVCWEPRTDPCDAPPEPSVVAERMRAAARMLAVLHDLPLASIGVAEEPALPVRDEVERWARLIDTVEPDIAPGHDEIRRRLLERVPRPVAPTLLHGDYRLGNICFDGAEPTAVIDWEIWSVGDPRTDLAWLLMHTDPVHRFTTELSAAVQRSTSTLPSRSELAAEYRALRRDDTPDLDWFLALCHYKVAATVSVFVKRNRRLAVPDPVLLTVGATLPGVVVRAGEILDGIERTIRSS